MVNSIKLNFMIFYTLLTPNSGEVCLFERLRDRIVDRMEVNVATNHIFVQ